MIWSKVSADGNSTYDNMIRGTKGLENQGGIGRDASFMEPILADETLQHVCLFHFRLVKDIADAKVSLEIMSSSPAIVILIVKLVLVRK